ncbi:hypothetical protein SLA2020_336650 [Shorea laevis]
MSNITVCARFRPLSSKEKRDHGDSVCIRRIDTENFLFKDEKEEDLTFSFDRVFYEESKQAEVYEFLALPLFEMLLMQSTGRLLLMDRLELERRIVWRGLAFENVTRRRKGYFQE